MNSPNFNVTDPASEIATLFIEFSKIQPSTESTQSILSDFFEYDPSTPEWYELIGAIATRIRILRNFIQTTQDRFVKDKMRSQTLKSLDHMAKIVSPNCMNQRWDHTVRDLFTDDHIGRLEAFAPTAEKYHPLRLLSEEERQQALNSLANLSSSLNEEIGIPTWAFIPILEGIETLERILKNLQFFGHRAAIDEIISLSAKIDGIANTEITEEHTGNIFATLKSTLEVISLVGGLLILPIGIYQGYHVYKEAILQNVLDSHDEKLKLINKKAGQKALPAPETTEVKEEQVTP